MYLLEWDLCLVVPEGLELRDPAGLDFWGIPVPGLAPGVVGTRGTRSSRASPRCRGRAGAPGRSRGNGGGNRRGRRRGCCVGRCTRSRAPAGWPRSRPRPAARAGAGSARAASRQPSRTESSPSSALAPVVCRHPAAAESSAGTISSRLRSRAASPVAVAAHEPACRVPRVRSGLRARAPRPRWSSRAGPAAAPGGRSGPPRISAAWSGYSRIVSAARQSHGPAARPSARRRWRPC